MPYRRLFIWVEGNDDRRFFETIVRPRVADQYDHIQVVPYACTKRGKLAAFTRSIEAMGADLVLVTDLNNSPCLTARKHHVIQSCAPVAPERIVVVVPEIESWYLAGINPQAARKLGLGHPGNTDHITKELFDAQMPAHAVSRIDFMAQILAEYSLEHALGNNSSLSYFARRFIP